MQSNYSQLADALMTNLRLAQPPVAITFTDAVPDRIAAHSGRVAAGCRFWQDAATSAFVTTSVDHEHCAVGIYTHNLEPTPLQQTDLLEALKVFGELSYVRPEDLSQIPVLRQRHKHVVYAPLAQSPVDPDVVLLAIDASQALILSEAVQQVEHDSPPAMGRPACAVIPQVMNSGRAALSLGCCGARAYLDIFTDNVALLALPGKSLALYVERIVALAGANAVLASFHHLRRRAIESGASPTIEESLAAMKV